LANTPYLESVSLILTKHTGSIAETTIAQGSGSGHQACV
jgi:hypothetical protein